MAPFNKRILLLKLSAVAVLLTISGLLTARDTHSQNLDKTTLFIRLKNATLNKTNYDAAVQQQFGGTANLNGKRWWDKP